MSIRWKPGIREGLVQGTIARSPRLLPPAALLFLLCAGCIVPSYPYRIALNTLPENPRILLPAPTPRADGTAKVKFSDPYLVDTMLFDDWKQFEKSLRERWRNRVREIKSVKTDRRPVKYVSLVSNRRNLNTVQLARNPYAALGVPGEGNVYRVDRKAVLRLLADHPADLVIVPFFWVKNVLAGPVFREGTNLFCPQQKYSAVHLEYLVLDGQGDLIAATPDFRHWHRSYPVFLNRFVSVGFRRCRTANMPAVDYSQAFEAIYQLEGVIR